MALAQARSQAFCLAVILGDTSSAADPEIRLIGPAAQPEAIELIGLVSPQIAAISNLPADDPRWTEHLALRVADDQPTGGSPAILGTYSLTATALRFTPRYSLRPGLGYRATATLPAAAGHKPKMIVMDFRLPEPPPSPPTNVTAIYPSAKKLPENQLRFYIHFSAPMSAGEAYQQIRLLRDDGQPISRAFLEIGEELWDGTGTRLTLLFDPGRVKQGLKPREEFGPVLEPDRSYRLIIDKSWRDANGNPLAAGFEKAFQAGPMIDETIDAKLWHIESPFAGTKDPLVLRFPRPLDRALLHRMINIASAKGAGVEGEITVTDEERRWEFKPDQPWNPGNYELVIDTALEDSAGNNLARAFEVDVFDKIDASPAPEFVRLPFEIKLGR